MIFLYKVLFMQPYNHLSLINFNIVPIQTKLHNLKLRENAKYNYREKSFM